MDTSTNRISQKIGLGLYTLGEEITNAVTHGLGAAFAIVGTVVLLIKAVTVGDFWCIFSSSVYGFSVLFLFLMSTLYHAINHKKAKTVFRVFDHTSIYLLIAGCYTPIMLVLMRDVYGWTVLLCVWAAAIVGIVLNAISLSRFKVFSMVCYLATGWCIVAVIGRLIQVLPFMGLVLLVAGGLCYTAGIGFYASKRRYFHSVWHLFVLAGAVFHYFCILLYVI